MAQIKKQSTHKPAVARKPRTKTGVKQSVKYASVGSSWEKRPSGKWTGGQASSLNPGSESATSRRMYRSSGFKARNRKVIRPRVRKQVRSK